MPKRKKCLLCNNNIDYVDYKNLDLLNNFINDKYKIQPRRITGSCSKHQRKIATAIKRARIMVLIPFVPEV